MDVLELKLRVPVTEDGVRAHQLVAQCPPLDGNSIYCNILQCTHFAETSVAAELDYELVGFVSAYKLPEKPETLFIWQVAVAEQARGMGLASRMIEHLLNRDTCQQVSRIETTITEDNRGSWALFERISSRLAANMSHTAFFDSERHFAGSHDTEFLVTIGPFERQTGSHS